MNRHRPPRSAASAASRASSRPPWAATRHPRLPPPLVVTAVPPTPAPTIRQRTLAPSTATPIPAMTNGRVFLIRAVLGVGYSTFDVVTCAGVLGAAMSLDWERIVVLSTEGATASVILHFYFAERIPGPGTPSDGGVEQLMQTERFANEISHSTNPFTSQYPVLAVSWREVRLAVVPRPPPTHEPPAPTPLSDEAAGRWNGWQITVVVLICLLLAGGVAFAVVFAARQYLQRTKRGSAARGTDAEDSPPVVSAGGTAPAAVSRGDDDDDEEEMLRHSDDDDEREQPPPPRKPKPEVL